MARTRAGGRAMTKSNNPYRTVALAGLFAASLGLQGCVATVAAGTIGAVGKVAGATVGAAGHVAGSAVGGGRKDRN
jgi:hypothetical protein